MRGLGVIGLGFPLTALDVFGYEIIKRDKLQGHRLGRGEHE